MEALVSQYISPEARCKTSGVQESFSQVTFKEVRCGGAGVAALRRGSVPDCDCWSPQALQLLCISSHRSATAGLLAHQHQPCACTPCPQVSGLWILLAGSVAAALLVFLGGQLALCCARRVSRTQTYRKSMGRLQTVRGSVSARHGAASGSDDNGETGSDAAAEAGQAGGPADPRALSAAVAELAAQLQQALAAQEAAASGGGCKEHFK